MSYLLKFIESSVTAFHAVKEAEKQLVSKGFTLLDEKKEFLLKPKGKYFVIRDDASLIAFVMPSKKEIEKSQILLSHTDSPTFRIKPQGEHQIENMIFWGLEVYGSPIYSTWLNRDLGVAGRIFFERNQEVQSTLIQIDDAPVMISQLPIHIDRTVNSEGLKIKPQEHLNALVHLTEKKLSKTTYLESLLKKKVAYSRLLNHELLLYPLDPPRFLGSDKNLLSSPRVDNLVSVAASLEALFEKAKKGSEKDLSLIYLASHEEVGSRTFSAASSPFFQSVFERIFYSLDSSFEKLEICKSKSIAFSLDGSHALDPKSKDLFEPRHTPLLGEGVALKVDTGASYAYSGEIIAKLHKLAKKHQIKIQNYLKKGDARQGSTIGPIFAEKMGIQTLDLGLAQLSMHASKEVVSCRDYDQLVKLLGLVLKDQL